MRDIESSRQPDGTVWVGVVLAFLLIGLSLLILLSRTSADSADRGLDPPVRPVTLVAQKTGPQAKLFAEGGDPVDPIAYFAE